MYFYSRHNFYFTPYKNSKVNGYCLFESIVIENLEITDSLRTFSENISYLKNDITIPKNTKIKFYEQISNGFVERYAIIRINGNTSSEIVIMDSFYPIEYENKVKAIIIEQIQKTINIYNY